jgi:hypothetical protein
MLEHIDEKNFVRATISNWPGNVAEVCHDVHAGERDTIDVGVTGTNVVSASKIQLARSYSVVGAPEPRPFIVVTMLPWICLLAGWGIFPQVRNNEGPSV